MNATDLIKLYEQEKGSAERGNFERLYQTSAEFCNPAADNIDQLTYAGDRKSENRMTDIGIKARRMFTAGMMAHLFPKGQHWVRIVTADKSLMENDEVVRALNSATKTFASALDESNFEEEVGNCIDHLGYIGTTAAFCEESKKLPFVFSSYYINNFYFCESYEKSVDTFIRDFKLTARQALQQFGDDCPSNITEMAESVSTANKEYKFAQFIMPRSDGYVYGSEKKTEKKIACYYVCLDTKEVVKETGYDEMPVAVGRFYRNSWEKYGRSPATEVNRTLPMTNRMEVTRIRAAERVSSPPWLAPNDGSVRRISNDQGSIIYWNAGNPLAKPEQLVPSDNPMVNDEMIQKKEQEVLDAFFIPLFNPLHNKQNMTAFESSERLNLSLQFLTPAVNRVNKYFAKPLLERAFAIMLRSGRFPELEIQELSEAKLDFDLVGKASLAARQIELFGTMTAIEQTGLIGQVKPEVWDNWDIDETARFIQEVNMVPISLQLPMKQIEELREARAQQAEQERMIQAAPALADAAQKVSGPVDENSILSQME